MLIHDAALNALEIMLQSSLPSETASMLIAQARLINDIRKAECERDTSGCAEANKRYKKNMRNAGVAVGTPSMCWPCRLKQYRENHH